MNMGIDAQKRFYEAGYGRARTYKTGWEWLDRWEPTVTRTDEAVAALPGGERLLDIGCGGGELLLKASAKYESVTGFDLAEVQLERAKEMLRVLGERCTIRSANLDTEGVPYGDDSFDAVTCISVLQFVFDVEHAVCEIHRVLRPGGVLVMEVNNLAFIGHRFKLMLGLQPRTSYFDGWDGGVLHYFLKRPLEELLRVSGFNMTRVWSAGRFRRLRALWPSLLAQNLMVSAQKSR